MTVLIRTIQEGGVQMTKNWFRNLPIMNGALSFGSLYQRNLNQPCLIVATGPSLDNDLQEIANFNGVIIAVDTALRPLKAAGLLQKVKFATTVDFSPAMAKKVEGLNEVDLDGITLVFIPEACPDVVSAPFGARVWSYQGQTYKGAFDYIIGANGFWCDGVQSGANLALFFAQTMGCSPIAFVGHDFIVHKTGKSHAAGVDHSFDVEADADKTREQQRSFDAAKKQTEAIIASNIGLQYVNCTSDGARIVGTVEMSLSEFNKKYRKTPFEDRMHEMAEALVNVRFEVDRFFDTKSDIIRQDIDNEIGQNPFAVALHGLIQQKEGVKYWDAVNYINAMTPNTPQRDAALNQFRRYCMHESGVAAERMLDIMAEAGFYSGAPLKHVDREQVGPPDAATFPGPMGTPSASLTGKKLAVVDGGKANGKPAAKKKPAARAKKTSKAKKK